jgi:hypothetical protein
METICVVPSWPSGKAPRFERGQREFESLRGYKSAGCSLVIARRMINPYNSGAARAVLISRSKHSWRNRSRARLRIWCP